MIKCKCILLMNCLVIIMKWIYSEKLKLYVCLEPLKADSNVINVAKNNDISLEWDDFGNIINIDFDDSKKLVNLLGGKMLSPDEYWTFYNELVEKGKNDIIDKLLSNKFAEVLDRVFLRDGSYIDHPIIIDKYEYDGERKYGNILNGRPGWILPSDIDIKSGLPINIRKKEKNLGLIKYWSPDLNVTKRSACFAIRGFVTSVASASFDLGIPVDSKQPKQMIRLCLSKKPKSLLSESELRKKEEEKSFNDGWKLVKKGFLGDKVLNYFDFKKYIISLNDLLNDALKNNKQLYFVMGHKNPDSDTVVSSVLESYRLYLVNHDDNCVYIPFIQSDELPDEIKLIIGYDLCNYLIYQNSINIEEILDSGIARIVFTDQNYQKEYQKYVIAITDHHLKSNELIEKNLSIPFTIKMIGSCSSIIAIKYAGSGFDFDKKLANIFYSGMLMDTENRVTHKMTHMDEIVMNLIKKKSTISDDSAYYIKLMNELIKEKNPERLYYRDYKKFFGYGFAVLKVKDFIDKNSFKANINRIVEIAKRDNISNNYFLSLIKIVQYNNIDLSVDKERIYYVFAKSASDEIKKICVELLSKIIKVSFSSSIVNVTDEYVEILNAKKQISRKKIAPAIEVVLKKTGQYVYYDSISKWVSRDFLTNNDYIKKYPYNLETDNNNRICNISYIEAKKLCEHIGGSMLSLSDYWKVYYEAKAKKQYLMLKSLTNPDFIEFLDSTSDEISNYLEASPGLISPDDIDLNSGLPSKIKSPNEYYNKSLWRYWSPPKDGDTYVFSRSYIFLLGQPCLDAKTHLNESFANLGIRLVRDNNIDYEIEIEDNNRELLIYYKSEYDDIKTLLYADSNFIE